jgi:hypothetical protein
VLKNDLQENWEKTAKSGDPAGPGGSCGFFFIFKKAKQGQTFFRSCGLFFFPFVFS